ncbi:MAG: MMPL family transporter, partial [Verrucomicrobiota bacterium]
VMLYGFGPVAVSFNRDAVQKSGLELHGKGVTRISAGILAVLVPLGAVLSLGWKEIPLLEANFHPFRIRESPSMVAWQQLQAELIGRENAIPTVMTGDSIESLHEEIEKAAERMKTASEEGLLDQYVLPTAFIPRPDLQKENAETIRALLGERNRLLEEMSEAGFSEEGTRLTATVFDAWQSYLESISTGGFALPSGKLAEWSINRLFSEKEGSFAALATVKPTHPKEREWVGAICTPDTVVASLGSLGTALNERISHDLVRVFLPMTGLLAIMLGLVFRHWKDLLLSLFSLVFTACVLVLVTIWTPMSWNSFNVCGLPLLFGTGLDFSIHMILALRRSGGDVGKARHGIGKALVFCGTSSAIGFGSLATASAYGLASLGIVCAVGIFVNMMVAVWLLPRWYRWAHRHERDDQPASPVR